MLRRVLLLVCAAAVSLPAAVDFQRQIRPVLAKKCFACHGPDAQARKANLRLDTHEGATGKGGGYAGIVPGNSGKSRIVARIEHPKMPMPPTGERLSAAEIRDIKLWIDEGAAYQRHWAFDAPRQSVAVPGGVHPVDHFVRLQLAKEGLQPSPEADRYTLARRVALDLTGLPPEPAVVATFVADKSAQAYDRLVDQLLASPHFGERWARVWLDLARYADTQGYEKDNRRTIWPYRDWVIRAFNENLPFDQFTLKQLAGDLLQAPSEQDLIATGFHRNTMTNTEGGTDDEEFRDAAVRDRVATTGQVWMGLTWGCAQCHSHKYDPLSHKEFFQLYAFYNQSEDSDKPDDRPTFLLASDVKTPIMRDLPAESARVTRILNRGNFLDPGDPVEARAPESFHGWPQDAPFNRLGLAQWLTDRGNPLTARVQVNRYWARLFGRGLVESEEDFGTQGLPPSHPELLDWLAVEYMNRGWDTKQLLKLIVTSATYKQSSDVSPEQYEKDRYNRLLARGPRFRLDAEMVRDQSLAASALLSRKIGGPSVMPWQPEGVWQVVYNGERWITSTGEDRYRRAMYTFLRRTSPYPSMITYDAPTGETCTIRRIRTNTPLQALAALNDPVSMEAAQRLAMRTLSESKGGDKDRADHMFRLLLVRPPAKDELTRILALHKQATAELRAAPVSARKLLHYDQTVYSEDREVTLVADARSEAAAAEWHYTTQDPGQGWQAPQFPAAAQWQKGKGLFGSVPKPDENTRIATPWDTENLWMRLEFDLPAGGQLDDFRFLIRTTSVFEAHINGVFAAGSNLDRAGYHEHTLSPEALASLNPGSRNTLAVRATSLREKSVGQVIDIGVAAKRPMELGKASRDDASRAAWVVVANTLLNLDEAVTRR
jgi:acyl-CoA-binding protein